MSTFFTHGFLIALPVPVSLKIVHFSRFLEVWLAILPEPLQMGGWAWGRKLPRRSSYFPANLNRMRSKIAEILTPEVGGFRFFDLQVPHQPPARAQFSTDLDESYFFG